LGAHASPGITTGGAAGWTAGAGTTVGGNGFGGENHPAGTTSADTSMGIVDAHAVGLAGVRNKATRHKVNKVNKNHLIAKSPQ
jgi:hypothetical protein